MSSKEPERKESTPKKEIAPARPRIKRRLRAIAPYGSQDIWYDFDRIFDDFRSGFEDLLAPWGAHRSIVPAIERMPAVDLEDRGKDYLLTAEMPGFKKEDVDLQVTDDFIEIKATVGWKYDEKSKDYICAERRCDSFYRMIELPEKIKPDEVKAELKEGVLEAVIPKKEPKAKKKVALK